MAQVGPAAIWTSGRAPLDHPINGQRCPASPQLNRSQADWRDMPNAAPICAQLTSRDRRISTTCCSWLPLPWMVSSNGWRRSSKRSVGNSWDRTVFDGPRGGRAMISLHSSTHSSQIYTAAGPAMSLLTSCCDLKQVFPDNMRAKPYYLHLLSLIALH